MSLTVEQPLHLVSGRQTDIQFTSSTKEIQTNQQKKASDSKISVKFNKEIEVRNLLEGNTTKVSYIK